MTEHRTYRLSFYPVMVRNEFRAIRGKSYRTIWYLVLILFIAFITFGFARNTLTYQKKLSSDPFSNWINLNYHAGTRDSLVALHAMIAEESFRTEFHIGGAYFYNKGMVTLRTYGKERHEVQYEARTIDTASKVIRDLLEMPGNTRFFPDSVEDPFRSEPNGVIITSRLCKEAGLDRTTTSFIRMKSPAGDFIPVPVLAIVDELPDLCDIVYTGLFYCKSVNPGFYDHENACYRIFIENMDTAQILVVLNELYVAMNITDPSTVETTRLFTGNRKVMNWKIEVGVQDHPLPVSEMNARLDRLASLQHHRAGQFFVLSRDSVCDASAFFHDYLAVEFRDLEKIREFSQYLSGRFSLQLNLEVLAARENYLYTGNLAVGAIVLLMVVSMLAVSVYLSSVIRNHLFSIKKNLGNFLAFGAGNATLMQLYIFISVRILCMAMLPAVLAAFCIGEFFEFFLLGKLLVIDGSQDYFSLVNAWFLAFLFLILVVAVFRTFISVRKILRQSPGNLIYERDHGS